MSSTFSDPNTIPSPADEEIARRVAELMALAGRPSVPRWQQTRFSPFGDHAEAAAIQGWTVIPQERDGNRRPAQGILLRHYFDGVQNLRHVMSWAKNLPFMNVSVLLGPCSGNAFAIDVDVLDAEMAVRVEMIAERTLGVTQLRRVGRAPKTLLVYRAATADEIPSSRMMRILGTDGEVTEHAIEIIGPRKLITTHGFHHATGQEFVWTKCSPSDAMVELAPVVTPAQIDAFLTALDEAFEIQGGAVRRAHVYSGEHGEAVPTVHVQKPIVALDRYRDVVVQDGLVVDGREQFLTQLSHRIVVDNAGAALTDEGREELEAVVLHAFSTHALLDGRWSGHRLETEVRSKVANLVRKVETGEIKPRLRGTRLEAKPSVLSLCQTHGDDDRRPTEWLDAIRSPVQNFGDKLSWEGVAMPTIPDHLRIAESPQEASDAISDAMDLQIGGAIREAHVWDLSVQAHDKKPETCGLTTLVTAPTGAGKTHKTVSHLKALDELKAVIDERTGEREPWPTLMLLPAYKNMEEVRVEAENRGLKVMVWYGKVKSGEPEVEGGPMFLPDGCRRWADVKRLQEAGKSSAPLCEAEDPQNPGDPNCMIKCPFFDECRYQKQKKTVGDYDLILAAHNYLTVSIPSALKGCRMVIIDESVRSQLTRTRTFSEEILLSARNLAFVTKHEKAEMVAKLERHTGISKPASDEEPTPGQIRARKRIEAQASEDVMTGMIGDREDLVEEILPVLRRGEDVAAFILADPARLDQLESCIAICTRTRESLALDPRSSPERVAEACSIATQKEIAAEARFWKILKERIVFLQHDAQPDPHAALGLKTNRRKMACGKRDLRIHYYRGPNLGPGKKSFGKIRLSWFAEANFQDKPMLLLDASANPEILSRALGRQLAHTPIDAPRRVRFVHVHGRSLSKSSLLPCPRDSAKASLEKATALQEVRTQISAICAMHVGGVVGCTTKAVEALILDGWTPPSNFVMLHYGATRGLNFASGYDAAIAIGVVNPSADQIDAEVAALQYADEEQEEPLDPIGDEARTKDDPEAAWSERVVRIPMRNGSTLLATQRSCPGSLAQIVYDQVRKEELMQFVGRLRPIHRHDSPTVYTIGSYVPEGVIVDEVVLQSDLVRFGAPLEAARRHQLPIAVDRPEDVLASELEAGRALEILVAATPSISRNLIHVRIADRLRYVPVYVSDAVDRMVSEGEAEVVYMPDRTPIVRPLGWVEDVEIHARRDAEYGTWMEALAWADHAGWQQDAPGEDVYLAKRPNERVGLAVVVEALKREIPGLRAQVEREEEAEFEAWLETHPELTE